MGIFKAGYSVALLLAIITVVEYIFAVNTGNSQVRFAGLAVAAVAKVYFIAVYFMHIKRIWGGEAAH